MLTSPTANRIELNSVSTIKEDEKTEQMKTKKIIVIFSCFSILLLFISLSTFVHIKSKTGKKHKPTATHINDINKHTRSHNWI